MPTLEPSHPFSRLCFFGSVIVYTLLSEFRLHGHVLLSTSNQHRFMGSHERTRIGALTGRFLVSSHSSISASKVAHWALSSCLVRPFSQCSGLLTMLTFENRVEIVSAPCL
ncbi:hypothetical protein JTE90_005228 [Oedothorax gibbosus]|uniref:Secreted protein n=1 Tax=Oedothorax gibbosus TaxID=931172 RepID=A0AAV6TD08_9ARAC|nr:hypothetical protein JTE90_005228 [Oedothorax gibbosus]